MSGSRSPEAPNRNVEVEKVINIYSSGLEKLKKILLEKNFSSVDALNDYLKSIGCYKDGRPDNIFMALFKYFKIN